MYLCMIFNSEIKDSHKESSRTLGVFQLAFNWTGLLKTENTWQFV